MMTLESYQEQKALISSADIQLLISEGFGDCTDFRNFALTYAHENVDHEVFEIHCGYAIDEHENPIKEKGLAVFATVSTWKDCASCLGQFDTVQDAIYAVQQHDIYKSEE